MFSPCDIRRVRYRGWQEEASQYAIRVMRFFGKRVRCLGKHTLIRLPSRGGSDSGYTGIRTPLWPPPFSLRSSLINRLRHILLCSLVFSLSLLMLLVLFLLSFLCFSFFFLIPLFSCFLFVFSYFPRVPRFPRLFSHRSSFFFSFPFHFFLLLFIFTLSCFLLLFSFTFILILLFFLSHFPSPIWSSSFIPPSLTYLF